MPHSLIVGMTGSGKTSLACYLSKEFTQQGISVAILDPMQDPRWCEGFQTTDPPEFLAYAQSNVSHVLMIDEGSLSIGKWKDFTEEMTWLATQSRHHGHSCFFISQRVVQMDPTIRHQCERAYVFACGEMDLRTFAEEWRKPQLIGCPDFQPGEFAILHRFQPLSLGRLDISTGLCYTGNFNVEESQTAGVEQLGPSSNVPDPNGIQPSQTRSDRRTGKETV